MVAWVKKVVAWVKRVSSVGKKVSSVGKKGRGGGKRGVVVSNLKEYLGSFDQDIYKDT